MAVQYAPGQVPSMIISSGSIRGVDILVTLVELKEIPADQDLHFVVHKGIEIEYIPNDNKEVIP